MNRIEIIVSSTREGRFSDKPTQWVVENLRRRSDMEIGVLDLRDFPLPMFNQAIPPTRAFREYHSDELASFAKRIDQADGFIVMVAEYNHGYTGVLKNAMDHTFIEWQHKPITFVGWGNVGGARAIEQLRNVSVEFEMAPLRHAVHILPNVFIEARSAEPFTISVFDSLLPKLESLADDLAWWSTVLANGRAMVQ